MQTLRGLVYPCTQALVASTRPPSLSRVALGTPLWSPFRRTVRHTAPVEMGRRSAKIATRKNKADAIKSKLYGKIGKKIVQIVKQGGNDPVTNVKLAEIIRQAKEAGVPKDVVERNIKNASDKNQADFSEVTYEAYGPGGTGFIIEALTDNLNRSAADIKSVINKCGCKPAEPGSVQFNFQRVGQVVLNNVPSEDAVFEGAMEAGCDDFQNIVDEDGQPTTSYKVFSSVEGFAAARTALTLAGCGDVDQEQSDLVYRPLNLVEVDDESFERCEYLVERLLELDDVDAVYSNCDGISN